MACLLIAATAASCSQDPAAVTRDALASGNSYFTQGQYRQASVEYRRAIQADARFGEARRQLAETYLRLDDPANALREFVRAADLLPDDTDLQLKLGNLFLAAGRFDDARARAEQVLRRDRTSAPAHVLHGNALAGLRDLDGALDAMERALAADHGSGATFASLGTILEIRGEQEKADDAFRQAVANDPDSALVHLSYASFLIGVRRLADAEQQLKAAHGLRPGDVTVNRALALFYTTARRQADAEPYLLTLAENPKDTKSQFSLVQLYLATGRRDDAVRVLRGLTAQTDTFADATLVLARMAYGDRDRARAHSLVQQVLDKDGGNARALLVKAQFLLAEHKPQEALTSVKAAVVADPSFVEGFVTLGEAYRASRDFTEAKNALNEALRLRPNDPAIQVALSRVHLATGDTDVSRQLAGRATSAAPNAPLARAAVIRAALAGGELARADADLKGLLAEHRDFAEAHVLEGALRLRQKDWARAERAFTNALGLWPSSLEAETGLITVALSTGRAAAARARAEQLVSTSSPGVDALLLAARTYGSLNELAKTEALLRRALESDPSRSEPYRALAGLYLEQNRLEEALTEYRALAKRYARSPGVHTMMGVILERLDRRAEAEDAYGKALALAPNAAVAANNKAGLTLRRGGSVDEALQLAQTAKARLPDSAEAADTLGLVYYQKGMSTQAVSELETAVRNDPASATFRFHLGLAYQKSGDLALARKTLEAGLKLDPSAPMANEARAALRGLQ